MKEGTLFAESGESEFFGSGLQEDGGVVAENAGEDLDGELVRGWGVGEGV